MTHTHIYVPLKKKQEGVQPLINRSRHDTPHTHTYIFISGKKTLNLNTLLHCICTSGSFFKKKQNKTGGGAAPTRHEEGGGAGGAAKGSQLQAPQECVLSLLVWWIDGLCTCMHFHVGREKCRGLFRLVGLMYLCPLFFSRACLYSFPLRPQMHI